MDDIGLIVLVPLKIALLVRGFDRFVMHAITVVTRIAARKRHVAAEWAAPGYPQATRPHAVVPVHRAQPTLGFRLWELDGLRSRGVISFDEYAFARHAALAGVTAGVAAAA